VLRKGALFPDSQGQKLALAVSYVPYLLDSGFEKKGKVAQGVEAKGPFLAKPSSSRGRESQNKETNSRCRGKRPMRAKGPKRQ